MSLNDLSGINVEVLNPETPFGGVQVFGAEDPMLNLSHVTVEIFNPESPFGGVQVFGAAEESTSIEINTGSPVQSVFGRIGHIHPLFADYDQFYAPLAAAVPPGGLNGQVLTKDSNASYDLVWGSPSGAGGLPAGGEPGDVLTKMSFDSFDADWATPPDNDLLYQPLDADLTILATATPAAGQYYGTNGGGTKGFHTLPAAGVTSVFTRTGAVVAASGDYAAFYSPLGHTHTFASLTSPPTTLAGYGITDAQPLDSDLTSIAALATTSFGRGALVQADAAAFRGYIGAGTGSGTVTNFSAGDLSPIFTTTEATTTSTPALSFALTNAAANSWFGNATGSAAAPAYNTSVFPASLMPGFTGGNVVSTPSSLVLNVASLPHAVPAAGSIVMANRPAPDTPTTGKSSLYVDPTSKTFTAADESGNITHTVRSATGLPANNFINSISDSGVVGYAAAASGGTPGGSDTQVQFNDGGVFGGDADLTYNKTSNTLTIAGPINANGSVILANNIRLWGKTAAAANRNLAIITAADVVEFSVNTLATKIYGSTLTLDSLAASNGFVKTTAGLLSVDTATYLTTAAAASAYQPLDTDLTTIAGLTATTDNFIVGVSSAWASRTPAQVRTTLTLVIGTNVQAWDADLDAIAATGSQTAYGRGFLTQVDATGARTYIGAGTGDVVGPAGATDNAIARFDTATGKLLQNSAVTVSDTTGQLNWNADTAIGRNSAGILEINNATAGQFRDLRLRTLTHDGAQLIIGAGGNPFSIGASSSSAGAGDLAIGFSSTATGQATCVGYAATGMANDVVLGCQAVGNSNCVVIGKLASAAATSFALGSTANASGAGSTAMGYASVADTPNIFVCGSGVIPINNVYFGKGRVNAVPTAWTLNGTGGSGSNIAGGALILAGGQGTGTGIGGQLIFQTSAPGLTGAGVNALDNRLIIDNTAANFAVPITGSGSVPTAGTTGQVLKKNSNTNYDYSWQADVGGAGSGDVVGPGSATDNAIARFDGTTGKLIQNTAPVTIADTGDITVANTASFSGFVKLGTTTGTPWKILYASSTGDAPNITPGQIAFQNDVTTNNALTIDGDNVFANSASYLGWQTSLRGTTLDTGFRRVSAGVVELNNGTAAGYRDLRLRTLSLYGATTVNISAPATLTGAFLKDDGTWAVPAGGGGTPGGADTQVQFNDGGAFGGDAGLTYNKTTDMLTALQIKFSGSNGIIYAPAGNGIAIYGNGTTQDLVVDAARVSMRSGQPLAWSSSALDALGGPFDTALVRNAAGVVEVNNGTAGQYRDLKLRTLTLSGATTINISAPALAQGFFLRDDGSWQMVTGGGTAPNDGAFGADWNGMTGIPPSCNAVYDWGHTFDTNDNGKVNVLDMGAGIVKTSSGGVVSAAVAGTDYEAALGNPGTNGYVLSSTTAGVRSWIAPSAGGGIGGSTGATDNAILRADGTGGATLQSSGLSINDSSQILGPNSGTTPTYSFAANPTTGFGSEGAYIIGFIGGVRYFLWQAAETRLAAVTQFGWTASDAYSSQDTGLARNATGVVEINNGTAGQYRDLYARNINLQGTGIITGKGTVPPGGSLDQVLAKNSASDYDLKWAAPPGGGNVSTSGTITINQYPKWASTTTISSISAATLKSDLAITKTDVGLGNVTNDIQTKAAVVPNTAPTDGQLLVGQTIGSLYNPKTISGSGATISLSTLGLMTISAIAKASITGAPTGAFVGDTDTQTLTNKRIPPRVTAMTSSATPAVNTDSFDFVDITALAVNVTSMSSGLTGTPNNFEPLVYRIKDNGTARTIIWGASFASSQSVLPTTTIAGKVMTVGLRRNTTTNTWECLAVDIEDAAFASLQTTAQNPTGTGTTAMMGLGAAGATIVPRVSGKICVTACGALTNTSTGTATTVLHYGTGTAPANGAGSSGTATPAATIRGSLGANFQAPFSLSAIITGLTIGTTYWLDLLLQQGVAGVAAMGLVTIAAYELP